MDKYQDDFLKDSEDGLDFLQGMFGFNNSAKCKTHFWVPDQHGFHCKNCSEVIKRKGK